MTACNSQDLGNCKKLIRETFLTIQGENYARMCHLGAGYVGLVTGVCLAKIGHQVICIDNNESKVALMQSGKSPIYEPGLDEIMQSAMLAGNLEFTRDAPTLDLIKELIRLGAKVKAYDPIYRF